MTKRRNNSAAVREQRQSPTDVLDFWPTPHWATRAALVQVLAQVPGLDLCDLAGQTCWDPCAGKGDMVSALRPYFGQVFGSDIHDYGQGFAVADFLPGLLPSWQPAEAVDWLIFNPPFNAVDTFVLRALRLGRRGVCAFVRLGFVTSQERYHDLFQPHPMTLWAPFVERVNLVPGQLDRDASMPHLYAWAIWVHGCHPQPVFHIPPCRRELERPGDWDGPSRKVRETPPMPLLDGGGDG